MSTLRFTRISDGQCFTTSKGATPTISFDILYDGLVIPGGYRLTYRDYIYDCQRDTGKERFESGSAAAMVSYEPHKERRALATVVIESDSVEDFVAMKRFVEARLGTKTVQLFDPPSVLQIPSLANIICADAGRVRTWAINVVRQCRQQAGIWLATLK